MKNVLVIIFLFVLNLAQGQVRYFQHKFNLSNSPAIRNERFNSGIATSFNSDAVNPYYYVGIGTSYNDTALAAPDDIADRLRFTRMNTSGNAVLSNLGYHFLRDGKVMNANGNSIAEIRNTANNGGYMAVGTVYGNAITGAVADGRSDILLTRLTAAGGVVWARRIDIGGGAEIAWNIRRSNIMAGNQPTWLICGETRRGPYQTDCFVARVDINGAVLWCRRYNFDPGGGLFNSARCIAKQLCEDTAGNIYVVGTLQDNAGANGIDGLAFRLNSAGIMVWVNNYNLASDDQFQAVRLRSNGSLIIGGFTNYGGMYNMQITNLSTAAGAIIFQNILRAGSGQVFMPGKCYDILEAPGQRFYLAGLLNQNGANVEMMYMAGAGGAAIRWNSYNPMLYNVGFCIDYAPGDPCPGIAYFSSLRNTGNPAVSDGHIMKTDLGLRTCNFLSPKPPANWPSNLVRYPRQCLEQLSYSYTNLKWSIYNYSNRPICWTGCTDAGAARDDFEPEAMAQPASKGKLRISPNPVQNTLHIELSAMPAGEYQVELIDMQGRLVQKRSNLFSKGLSYTDLDMSSAAPGMYLLTIRQGTMLLQQKVLKQ